MITSQVKSKCHARMYWLHMRKANDQISEGVCSSKLVGTSFLESFKMVIISVV